MFWATLALKWHFVRVQSQPKVWMPSLVAFSVAGVTQSSLCSAGSHGRGQSYSPSFPMGLVICLPHPQKPCKAW